MEYYKLQWYNLSLLVACEKCGSKIPLQGIEGNPSCTNCGFIALRSWEHALKYCEVDALKKGEAIQSTIIGEIQATIKGKPVKQIVCFSCNTAIDFGTPAVITENCGQCSTNLQLASTTGLKDLVFYIEQKKKSTAPTGHIAVRCAACGAGVQTDPNDIHYHCDACGVDNILPMALRAKTELNEVFVGVKMEVFPPKLLSETNNPDKARRVLHQHKREDFANEQLESALLRFPGNATIFTMIKDGYRFEIPQHIYQTLWEKTNNEEICWAVGKALGKSEREITERIRKINPNYQAKKNVSGLKKSDSIESKVFVWIFGILIGLMIMYIVYYNFFRG